MNVERREGEVDGVKPLELFFDLVFVLGFTQCTALMVHDPSWQGLARGVLVLALLWWSWVAYAWLTSVLNPEEGAVRLVMFAAMAALLNVALSIPEAYGDRAVVFAVAYGFVRAAHIALYLIASREDAGLRHSVVGLAVSTTIGVTLVLLGAVFADGTAQSLVWLVAIVLDAGEPAVFGTEGWTLVPGHFAERHGLIIILALGESIVALGIAAASDPTAGLIAATVLGIGIASALWWIYFDVVSLVTARRLEQAPAGRVRNTLARDSYSYLHFPMVAGIVLTALGMEATLHHVDEHLDAVRATALLGGVALYLLAHVALRLRNARTVSRTRLGLAAVLLLLIPAATTVSALVTVAVVNVLVWAMIAYETNRIYGDNRYRLRHGLEA
jgi:low temperature requirement protein LtrA